LVECLSTLFSYSASRNNIDRLDRKIAESYGRITGMKRTARKRWSLLSEEFEKKKREKYTHVILI
jgi:hypothetical protein